MARSWYRRSDCRLLSVLICCLVPCQGCRDREPKYEVISLEGTVEKIKRTSEKTGEITVLYFNEKYESVVGTGIVTKDTEILINGAIAGLKDVRVGDHAQGEVRIERNSKERKQIALKINIDRAEPIGSRNGSRD